MVCDERRAKGLIDQQARDHEKGGAGNVEDRAHGVGEDVIEPLPPALRPHVPEGRHDAIGDDGLESVGHAGKRIEADRPLGVGRVDVDEIVGARARYMGERGFGEVAMRIEQVRVPRQR